MVYLNLEVTKLKKRESKFEISILIEDYNKLINCLRDTGILSQLPASGAIGVLGIDDEEYPVPTPEQVEVLFEQNKELIELKMQQGFTKLIMTPLALPMPKLIELLQAALFRHGAEGRIYLTRNSDVEPLIPARVNKEKQVWPWDRLLQSIADNEVVYFPKEYTAQHQGLTKQEAIHSQQICAFPGWSVGLIEVMPLLPKPSEGQIINGRQQLEIGHSPREYMQMLKTDAYRGETGFTLEDFIIKFILHLEETNEISHDRYDDNALWCLAQYIKISYAECVPVGSWNSKVGRLRLDMHRTGNKKCTKSVGAATIVRISAH